MNSKQTKFTNQELEELGYRLIKEIGRNDFGGRVTFLAEQFTTGHKVVVKLFTFSTGSNWQELIDLERESEYLKTLNHPAIPKFIEQLKLETAFALVMQYCPGESLDNLGKLTLIEIENIAKKILNILVYLQFFQPPIIHRDIKPSNIIYNRSTDELYLVDFGIAKSKISANTLTSSGTFGFMAPEQMWQQPLGRSTDLFGLGITITCLLTATKSVDTGRFRNENFEVDIRPHLPDLEPTFLLWLDKLLATKQINRYPNAENALDALTALNLFIKNNLNESLIEENLNYVELVTSSNAKYFTASINPIVANLIAISPAVIYSVSIAPAYLYFFGVLSLYGDWLYIYYIISDVVTPLVLSLFLLFRPIRLINNVEMGNFNLDFVFLSLTSFFLYIFLGRGFVLPFYAIIMLMSLLNRYVHGYEDEFLEFLSVKQRKIYNFSNIGGAFVFALTYFLVLVRIFYLKV